MGPVQDLDLRSNSTLMYFFFYVRKGKGKKEEEKMKEVEIVSEVQDEINLEDVQWQPPPDFMLMNYIHDASETILPLTTTREQVVALAQ